MKKVYSKPTVRELAAEKVTSLFEIFKVGIEPSSPHTVGLMRAAGDFVAFLGSKDLLLATRRIQVELYGSLALTGNCQGTGTAVMLGLSGERPECVKPGSIQPRLAAFRETQSLPLRGVHVIPFVEARDIFFHKDQTLAGHSNDMRFSAFGRAGGRIAEQVYFSTDGDFVIREGNEPIGTTLRDVSLTVQELTNGRPGTPRKKFMTIWTGFGR